MYFGDLDGLEEINTFQPVIQVHVRGSRGTHLTRTKLFKLTVRQMHQ